MKPDTNESRRKRRRISTIGAKDAKTPISSHPSPSQDTALDLTSAKSRITSRVIDELIPASPSQVPNNQQVSFFTTPKNNTPASREQKAGRLQNPTTTSDTFVVADKPSQLKEAVAQPRTLTSTETRPDRLKRISTSDIEAQRRPAKILEDESIARTVEATPHGACHAATTSAQTSDKMAPNKTVKMLNFNAKSGTIGSPPSKKLSKAALNKAEKEAKAIAAKEEASKQEEVRKGHMDETKANDAPLKKPRRARKKAEPVEKFGEILKSVIVKISYGNDEEKRMSVGYTIDAIREGKERRKIPLGPWMSIANKKRSRKQAAPSTTTIATSAENARDVKVPESKVEGVEVVQAANPKPATKPAHPFFLGKAALKPAAQMQGTDTTKPSSARRSRQTTPTREMPKTNSTVTPRKIARSGPQGTAAPTNVNSFTGFGVPAKMQKVPGALEPAWPARGMVHVRGDMDDLPMLFHDDAATPFISKMRKSKFPQPMPAAGEDIVVSILARLNIGAIRQELHQVNDEQPPQPDKHLRLPNRGFESGVKLQRRISSQIKVSITEMPAVDDSEDELAKQTPGLLAHPAVSNLYRKIPQTLSAFDKGESDTQTWSHKYAPTCAKEVLQSGPDAQVLKSWLQTLTVAAVDSGAVKKEPTMEKKKDDAAKGKRKKKLDGFIVDSDEEENEMAELASFDDSPPGSQSGPKTVIRRGDMGKGFKEATKLMNAVLLSGPNGCGKTAAIYAVAKELDFEVFEINSSTRRSGKDILEKVGDMTKNHLVQHKKRHSGGEPDEDLQRANEALDADLKSGRQGTMMSFFSKKAEPKPKQELKSESNITLKFRKQETLAPSKSKVKQKQSLILLEEVDVLYEEDKEFWKTIIDLAASSKRPVIMTCNDESLVPKQALPLHAIVRFAPPPVEMAVDYLLLVAANEGHVLHRNAVTQLYQAHQEDLRSSLTELQFWCQFCVGDRRAGFDWFIPRWPKGQDLDAHGRKLRVISEGTYRLGMGMLGHDYLCSTNNISNPEEEMLKEAWDSWQVDAGDWHDLLKLDQWSSKAQVPMAKQSHMGALKAYEEFTDAMSTADICSRGWFGTEDDIMLDTSLPPTFPKALDDNVLGSSFVKADPVHRQTTLERDIAISMKIMAREAAQRYAAQYPNASIPSFQQITEKQVDKFIVASLNKELEGVNRYDFGHALDPLATVDNFADQSSTYFPASVIDRTTKIIALDVAPYVRGIVAYDAKLAEERKKLSNLLSEGGRPGRKKMRTTRAAMSALEGGERKSTRKEKWFGDKANSILVRKTGLPAWERALDREKEKRREQAAKEREEAGVKVKKQEE